MNPILITNDPEDLTKSVQLCWERASQILQYCK